MASIPKEKLDLVNRTKKNHRTAGKRAARLERRRSLRGSAAAAGCGAINSLMAELMEEHLRNHLGRRGKGSEEAADLVEIVRSYLK
jgi:hypothetical protein